MLRIVPHRMFNKLDKCLYSWVIHPLMNRFLRGPFGCLCCTIKFNSRPQSETLTPPYTGQRLQVKLSWLSITAMGLLLDLLLAKMPSTEFKVAFATNPITLLATEPPPAIKIQNLQQKGIVTILLV
uniref:Uncharacterized protein n=1 Tax=Glycine max TaxID=3847 RepID=C6TEM7_SOYBN|nr:unknown [Glycine max]